MEPKQSSSRRQAFHSLVFGFPTEARAQACVQNPRRPPGPDPEHCCKDANPGEVKLVVHFKAYGCTDSGLLLRSPNAQALPSPPPHTVCCHLCQWLPLGSAFRLGVLGTCGERSHRVPSSGRVPVRQRKSLSRFPSVMVTESRDVGWCSAHRK